MDHDIEKANNMKLLLTAFEQLSELKINLDKSELFCYGETSNFQDHYRQIFDSDIGDLLDPFTYLGIPMHHRKLHNSK